MADNTPVKNASGATVTAATKDVGSGVQAPKVFLVDATATDAIGEVAASPTANTLLARLKDINTSVTSGTVDVGTAGSASADVLTVQGIASMTPVITASGDRTDAVMNGQTALTPKFAKIAASSSGDNTLVAAVSSKKIRVLAYNLMGNGAVNAKFQSGAAGTDLTGLKYIAAAGGGICAPYNPAGWFETAATTLLNLNLSGAVAVGGELTYIEV